VIATVEQADSWQLVITAAHLQDTVVIEQLMNAVALSQYNYYSKPSIAPSAAQPIGEKMSSYYVKGSLASLAKKYSDLPIIANGGVSELLLAIDSLERAQRFNIT